VSARVTAKRTPSLGGRAENSPSSALPIRMRAAAGRRLALHLAAAWCTWRTAPVEPSAAWCGAPYPPFAYSLPWYEFPVGSAAVRVVGDISAERAKKLSPLLVLPPPGLGYEYLETLEALTISERRVAFATLAPASPDALAEQVGATLESLEAPRAHVLAHATAAPAALALAAARPRAVASLVLASPLLTADDAGPARAPLELSDFLGSATSSARACVDAELNRLRSRGPRPSADAYVTASAAE